MNNIIVTRISNDLGNQLFKYAAAYALAKKLRRKLLIDNESSYFKKKNSLRKYELHNLSSQTVDKKYKFNNYLLDTKRKFLKKVDYLLTKCKYFIVGPTSFHWWGAWLSEFKNKICVRPKNINQSNNKDFCPQQWISL